MKVTRLRGNLKKLDLSWLVNLNNDSLEESWPLHVEDVLSWKTGWLDFHLNLTWLVLTWGDLKNQVEGWSLHLSFFEEWTYKNAGWGVTWLQQVDFTWTLKNQVEEWNLKKPGWGGVNLKKPGWGGNLKNQVEGEPKKTRLRSQPKKTRLRSQPKKIRLRSQPKKTRLRGNLKNQVEGWSFFFFLRSEPKKSRLRSKPKKPGWGSFFFLGKPKKTRLRSEPKKPGWGGT